jgi:hypothetical protein
MELIIGLVTMVWLGMVGLALALCRAGGREEPKP